MLIGIALVASSLMASAFSLLTSGGAKFNPKYRSDVDLFAANRSGGKGKTRAAKASSSTVEVIPSSLDFFGAGSSAQITEELGSESGSSSSGADAEVEAQSPQPRHKITIDGPEPLPTSVADINDLLSRSATHTTGYIAQNLRNAGVSSLWGVQCAVAGCYLERRDTLVVAPTGSGKTLAYLLPLFISMQQPCRAISGPEAKGIRSLIVVPTYDLAVQIRDVAESLASGRKWRIMLLSKPTEHAVVEAANGGEDALGIDILICTPERLHHLIDQGNVHLASVQHLIFDEADRLLSDEFHQQALPILDECRNNQLQKCFLSATIPSGVETEAKRYMKHGGTRVVVGVKDAATTNISQSLLYTGSESGKMMALRNMISGGELPYPSLIFVQSIERANELYRTLVLDGLLVDVVHGERSKSKREEAIKSFRQGRVWVLVVTDVLARGMDFRGVQVVVNYDFPQTVQSYIHRIGRTGRAGRPGKAVTFFSVEDGPHLRTVANVLRASGCDVPQYMLDMPKPSKNMKRKLRNRPVDRKQVGGSGRNLAREDAKRKNDMRAGTTRKPKSRVAAPEVNMDE